jgi:hypothetical protein
MVQVQLREKVSETLPPRPPPSSQSINSWCVGGTWLSSQLCGNINRQIIFQASLGIAVRCYLKNNQSKKG